MGCVDKLEVADVNVVIADRGNIAIQHKRVGADIIRPRNLHNFIGVQPVGTALAAVRYRRSRYRVIAIVIS